MPWCVHVQDEALRSHVPEFTIIHVPGLFANPAFDGTRSSTFICAHMGKRFVGANSPACVRVGGMWGRERRAGVCRERNLKGTKAMGVCVGSSVLASR